MEQGIFIVRNRTRYLDAAQDPAVNGPATPHPCRPSGCVEYVRVWRHFRLRAVADFAPNGREDFSDQEGDDGWHPFAPSPEERAFALRLLSDRSLAQRR
jgi:hypothetical protein